VSGSESIGVPASASELSATPSSMSFPAGVRDGYERWAPTYDHFPNPLLAREERHILPLLPQLRNRCVLDLACGTGRWLERFFLVGAHPGVGVDLSSAMLRQASVKKDLPGTVVQADCVRLPFRPSTFDFSICSFALGHIPDLRTLADELSRVLKPGSDLFVTDLHPEAFSRGWRTGFRDLHSAVEVQTLPHSADDILEAFASVGCECVTCDSLFLGDAEAHLFAAAGRPHLFQAASGVPAIFFCHLKRVAQHSANRGQS
jgi:ubiquinone/menaquinone biosynthesis C-methylase UbiE